MFPSSLNRTHENPQLETMKLGEALLGLSNSTPNILSKNTPCMTIRIDEYSLLTAI